VESKRKDGRKILRDRVREKAADHGSRRPRTKTVNCLGQGLNRADTMEGIPAIVAGVLVLGIVRFRGAAPSQVRNRTPALTESRLYAPRLVPPVPLDNTDERTPDDCTVRFRPSEVAKNTHERTPEYVFRVRAARCRVPYRHRRVPAKNTDVRYFSTRSSMTP